MSWSASISTGCRSTGNRRSWRARASRSSAPRWSIGLAMSPGGCCRWIGVHAMAAPVLHTDDTPIAVLAPGNGKTRTGRLWTYVVDERPWQGGRAPAAYYRFSPDRKGERPRDHLAGFRGVIQADAFSGYESLARAAPPKGPIGRGPPPLIH